MSERLLPIPVDAKRRGPQLWVPVAVAKKTESLLRSYGKGRHEGVVYWGGVESPGGSVVTTALSPRAATTWGSFQTDVDANFEVVGALSRMGLTLVAQVHSHPGSWVDHSEGDDAGALVRFEGYWSVVVPQYAKHGMQPLGMCGVHLFQGGAFCRLSSDALEGRVHLLPAGIDLRAK